VLVVEDNPINQQVARELLAAAGAEVRLAVNGREAVLAVAADSYDAVLMDVQMPVMDGYQATRDIRQKLRQTELPIIAMTANAMDSDREQCRAAGMDDHVGKPFVPADLVATILRHLRRGSAAEPAATTQAAAASEPPRASAAPGASAAPAEPIDRAAALAFLGGDQALYDSLLPTFCADLRETLRKMASLPDGLPRSDATLLLHSLKSTAATFGARQLAAAAAAAERQSKDPATVLDARLLAPVSQEIQRALAVLEPAAQG
jgi:CheY-like chemotaxis protein